MRHITQGEAETPRWGNWRWLVVNADEPDRALFYRGMLGIPEGADYLIGAISQGRRWERIRGYKLVLSPEMRAFEAAKHGLETAVNLLREEAVAAWVNAHCVDEDVAATYEETGARTELIKTIVSALFDPAKYVERKMRVLDPTTREYQGIEALEYWQARAVIAALGDSGS